MQLSTHSFSLLLLGTTAYSFVVTTYSKQGCSGDEQSVNIWDNTCATWMNGFQSVTVTTYGGGGQYGRFYSQNACALGTTLEGKADEQVVENHPDINVLGSGICYDTNGGTNAIGSAIYTI